MTLSAQAQDFRSQDHPHLTHAAAGLMLYDTASHSVSPFNPIIPGNVGIYVCGATVQSGPHIGHVRTAIAFDIVRRWLMRLGYKVRFIRNVTDIDDKILDKAAAAHQQWWERAYLYEREFSWAYRSLGTMAPTYEPRATGHITDMVELIERLIDRGHAYVVRDQSGLPSGNVYFDVPSWPHYGELTHQQQRDPYDSAAQQADIMGPSVDTEGGDRHNAVGSANSQPGKRDPRDFALWKAPKADEPSTAQWDTAFGAGRPGWHIECSAMSHRYLGEMFDIHGGGLDLRFPHHENEMAQTRAAGWRSANRWMHSAWVTAKGEKMSKSLGNGLSVPIVLANHAPWTVRYALGSAQYRSMLEWSDQILMEAQSAHERISNFIERAGQETGMQPSLEDVRTLSADELPPDFIRAMNDDVNVSGALACIFASIHQGNTILNSHAAAMGAATRDGSSDLSRTLLQVRAMLDTLGLDPLSPTWGDSGLESHGDRQDSPEHQALDQLIGERLETRDQARRSKNFAAADAIRDRLNAAGIEIEDGPGGSSWNLR